MLNIVIRLGPLSDRIDGFIKEKETPWSSLSVFPRTHKRRTM